MKMYFAENCTVEIFRVLQSRSHIIYTLCHPFLSWILQAVQRGDEFSSSPLDSWPFFRIVKCAV